MKSEFEIAITQLCSDRNLSPEVILEAIEAALVSAYKRNFGSDQNVTVKLDPRTGQAQVYVYKVVVAEVEDDDTQMLLDEALKHDAGAKIGDTITLELKPRNFGRIAAQTAKQVIMQRIREAERDSVYLEFAEREGEIVNGIVRSVDARSHNVTISMGKAEALLPRSEQIPGENCRFNQRIRVYISEVARIGRGPQITVSRTHPGLLRRLLELEVPEVFAGTVEIKAIAREAGWRSKVAVHAVQPGIDPVGSCVGMRGVRIQNVVNELSGEKIDVVEWAEDPKAFISNALSPAKVVAVYLNPEEETARVIVPDRALSLAIGKEGQNARLAAKLTGWRIDISSETEAAEQAARMAEEAAQAAIEADEMEAKRQAAAELLAEAEEGLEPELTAEPSEAEEPATVAVELPVDALEPATEADTLTSEPQEEPAATDEELVSDGEPESDIEPETVIDQSAVDEFDEDALVDELDEPAEMTSSEPETLAEEETESEETQPVDFDEMGDDETFDDDDESSGKDRRKSNRGRRLEYDERLGRVVARKKRKPSRRRSWEEEEWD